MHDETSRIHGIRPKSESLTNRQTDGRRDGPTDTLSYRDAGTHLITAFSFHQHLNLECTIHLLYLVTPYDAVADVKPQWMTYFDTLSTLDPVEIKAAELIGW